VYYIFYLRFFSVLWRALAVS